MTETIHRRLDLEQFAPGLASFFFEPHIDFF